MPGSSLWLLPPSNHPLLTILQDLIRTIPSEFPGVNPIRFEPHVTLTSNISTEISSPQLWLDNLDFSMIRHADVKVQFTAVDTEEPFVRKLTLRVKADKVLLELVRMTRRAVSGKDGEDAEVERWLKEIYAPHCSLMYAGITILEDQRGQIEQIVKDAGVNLEGQGKLSGWEGGRIWLVPTYKQFSEWEPIAERVL